MRALLFLASTTALFLSTVRAESVVDTGAANAPLKVDLPECSAQELNIVKQVWFHAAAQSDVFRIKTLAKEHPSIVDVKDSSGKTALDQKLSMFNVNKTLSSTDKGFVKALLDKGARINLISALRLSVGLKDTAYLKSALKFNNDTIQLDSALREAVKDNQRAEAGVLLTYGANPNAVHAGKTVLELAKELGFKEMYKLLYDAAVKSLKQLVPACKLVI